MLASNFDESRFIMADDTNNTDQGIPTPPACDAPEPVPPAQPQQPLELIPLRVGDDQIRMPHVGLLPNETRPQSTVLRAMAHRAQIALLG